MFHTGDDDLVARAPLPGHGASQRKGHRRHVGAEDDLTRIARAEEFRDLGVRVVHQLLARHAGREVATQIGVGLHQGAVHRLDNGYGNLTAGRTVEEYRRVALNLESECRKIRA